MLSALFRSMRAAWRKMAAWRRIGRRRQIPFQPDMLSLRTVNTRDGSQQCPGIRMLGCAQHFLCRAALHDAPEVHHAHFMRKILHHREIMGDEQITQFEFLLQRFQQIQDLRLHRHIQRAGRFVADQHLR